MEYLVLDWNYIRVGVIDVFESMIWKERYIGFGDFEFVVENNTQNRSILLWGNYLMAQHSDNLMIIETIYKKTDVENGDRLIVYGRSLESIIERRIVWNQTVIDSSLQNAIKQLLNENITSSAAISSRRISNFVIEDSTDAAILALNIKAQFHGENLYDVINGICTYNDIGFKVTFSATNTFVFKLYKGIRRDYTQLTNPYVVFSEKYDNLINSESFYSIVPFKNTALVGGEGDGINRKLETVALFAGPPGSGLFRKEIFTDASYVSSIVTGGTLTDTQYHNILAELGNEDLAKRKPLNQFTGKINDINSYIYQVDYKMGDIVQIVGENGEEVSVRVKEVITATNSSGTHIYQTFDSV